MLLVCAFSALRYQQIKSHSVPRPKVKKDWRCEVEMYLPNTALNLACGFAEGTDEAGVVFWSDCESEDPEF